MKKDIKTIIKLMNQNGYIEEYGLGMDFDSIGAVVGEIKGKDITKISTSNIYLEDDTILHITKLTKKHIYKIINIIENLDK